MHTPPRGIYNAPAHSLGPMGGGLSYPESKELDNGLIISYHKVDVTGPKEEFYVSVKIKNPYSERPETYFFKSLSDGGVYEKPVSKEKVNEFIEVASLIEPGLVKELLSDTIGYFYKKETSDYPEHSDKRHLIDRFNFKMFLSPVEQSEDETTNDEDTVELTEQRKEVVSKLSIEKLNYKLNKLSKVLKDLELYKESIEIQKLKKI